MESAVPVQPHVHQRMFLLEPIGGSRMGAGEAGAQTRPQLTDRLSLASFGPSKRPIIPAGCGVSIPKSSVGNRKGCRYGGSGSSSSNSNNDCNIWSPVIFGKDDPPNVLSPPTNGGVKQLQGRSHSNSALLQFSDCMAPLERINSGAVLTTPFRGNAIASSLPSTSSTTMVLQGAGGGRRIFKRVGMSCVYDMYGNNATQVEDGGMGITETVDKLVLPVKESSGNASYVRPWLRQQALHSPLSFPGGTSTPLSRKEERLHIADAVAPHAIIQGKARNLNFNGTHRRRRNCRCHQAINEGDLHVAELPHTDSSHYIRGYPLTSTTNVGETTLNQDGCHRKPLDDQSTTGGKEKDGMCVADDGVVTTAVARKSSATLSRTLSNLRTKSRGKNGVTPSVTRRASSLNINEMEDKHRTVVQPPSLPPHGRDRSIIQEMWTEMLLDTSSNSSISSNNNNGLDGAQNALDDDDNDSCCSCCSCWIGPGCQDADATLKNVTSGGSNPAARDDGNTLTVAYNNFFDDDAIPILSIQSFRRASNLSSKTR